jgi:hypothetical protein
MACAPQTKRRLGSLHRSEKEKVAAQFHCSLYKLTQLMCAKTLSIPRAEGFPPLHLSVKIGALRCAERVLGAQLSHANLHTLTIPFPLHVVAASCSDFAEGGTRMLLQAGADVTAKVLRGVTAADVAAAAGNASLSRMLHGVAAAAADFAALYVSAL